MSDWLLDDEERDKIVEQCMAKGSDAVMIDEALIKAEAKKLVEGLDKRKVGEFCIVGKQFVDGEPNCVIFTQVDWQALKKEVEDG